MKAMQPVILRFTCSWNQRDRANSLTETAIHAGGTAQAWPVRGDEIELWMIDPSREVLDAVLEYAESNDALEYTGVVKRYVSRADWAGIKQREFYRARVMRPASGLIFSIPEAVDVEELATG
jgi:hypothetical protein